MRWGGLAFFSGLCWGAGLCLSARRNSGTWPFVVLAVVISAFPARAAQLEEMGAPDLPWSALPGPQNTARVLKVSVPRLPLAVESDIYFSFAVETNSYLSDRFSDHSELIGALSWSSETTSLFLGTAIDEETRKTDRLFGAFRKKWKKKSAVYVFDHSIGFSTDFVVDILSKNKQRGLKDFKILQLSLSSPFADGGNITAASALTLDGLTPELKVGIRLYLPLGGPEQ